MTEERNREKGGLRPSLVVGVGASAGGLEAFKQLLSVLPNETGMAFILAQHVAPTHKSLLTGLLAPCTAMRVIEAGQGMELEADTVYIIGPGRRPAVRNGRIELIGPTRPCGDRLLIDHLFHSLAREFGSRAVGIILTGANHDGSAGVRDIKVAGGLAIVQDPSTASQPRMPQSAIDPGGVDLVLPISEIPAALERFVNLPPAMRGEDRAVTADGSDDAFGASGAEERSQRLSLPGERWMGRLAAVLAAHADFNLRVYKSAMIERRLLRRMTLAGFATIDSYLAYLRDEEAEQQALVRDFLISVTDFFRDAEAFDRLRDLVIHPLVSSASSGGTLRAWVSGCATGEEAYSIAMALLDAIEAHDKKILLQIFATDIDQDALAIGRAGVYPPTIAEHVSNERLQKYFSTLDSGGYRVRPPLRDAVSFAIHDVCKDPPFSRMDLVSCRNVLIYLQPASQEHVLKVLHFGLQPDRYLFLGLSESTGSQRQLFSTLSKKWRIYRKAGVSRPPIMPRGNARFFRGEGDGTPMSQEASPRPAVRRDASISDLARRVVMQARVAPTIVIAESGEIIFMHGELRPYLRFPQGEPRLDLASLVTEDLATRTRAALYKCRRDEQTVVALSSLDSTCKTRTKITATPAAGLGDGAVILTFEEVEETVPGLGPTPESPAQEAVIEQLEKELQATRADLRDTVEELETLNEELRASNEESMSMNEELQSANEELEATTEELRSLNEELTTVNAQLRDKVEQLEQAHDDLSNFFASTKIATVFLDERLCIKRFTPAAAELLRIDDTQQGRFVGDIARELLQSGLDDDARSVLEHLSPNVRELRTGDGRWVARRVLPYRTESRRIEGVVVTLVDITDFKTATEQLAVRERQQAVIARLGLCALEEPDLQRFMENAVREVQQTLETDYCKILELQPVGTMLLLRAGAGWREGLVGHATVSAGIDSQAGFTLMVQGPLIVEDLATERRFHGPPLLFEHGVTSGMSCIIHDGDEPYGVLGAHTRQRRVFRLEDTIFLQAVATMIAAAISRDQTRIRLALEGAAAKALTAATSLLDAAGRIHAAMRHELGAAIGELWLAPKGGGGELTRLLLSMAPPYRRQEVEPVFCQTRMPVGEGLIGRVFAQRRAEWVSCLNDESHFLRARAARELGLASGLALPILAGDDVLGVINVFSTQHLYTSSVLLRSLESIGRAIGEFTRRAEAEAKARWLAAITESAQDAIFNHDFDGRITGWLHGAERLYGYTNAEILGTSINRMVPEDRQEALWDAIERLQRGEVVEPFETVRIRKDGTQVHVSVRISPVRDEHGGIIGVSAADRDATEQRRATEALAESERRFRQVLLNSPVPMMVFDDTKTIIALSRSWSSLTGYEPEEIPTIDAWVQRAHPHVDDRADGVPSYMAALWATEEASQQRELEIWTKHGQRKTLLFSLASLGRTSDGHRLRICAAADVTERKEAAEELVRASQQKDEFIAMLGHELRNPLAAVRGAAELLKRAHAGDPILQKTQSILERQTAHMAKLLDGLLDVSRIVRGKIVLDTCVVAFDAILRNVCDDFAETIDTCGLELHTELPAAPLWVEADPVRLTQIVDNLLSNAIRYTKPPGTITLGLRCEDGAAILAVRDTGMGIDPELLPHVFEVFRQARQSLDRSYGGLGLGLALVKALVELHGGRVEARSDGVGRGAAFVVRLPLTLHAPPPSDEDASGADVVRILIVEDNEDAAEMLREILELDGHGVAVANRGRQAIAMAKEHKPDVVLCDLGLPDGMTGFDVAREIRRDPQTRNLLLVALTGYGRPEDWKRSEEAGFDVHLTKPVDMKALARVIADLRRRGPSRP